MKKKFRVRRTRGIAATLTLSLALTVCLSGCQPNDSESSSGTGAASSVSSVDISDNRQAEETKQVEPIDFTWQPKVYSDYQKQGDGAGWGPKMEQLYYDSVDAIMKGAESVTCPGEEYYGNLLPLLQSNFPVVSGLGVNMEYSDGVVHFIYADSPKQREQTILKFAEKVERYIESSVCEDDTPTMAALALYCHFVQQLEYDHAAAALEKATDVTPYRALMTGEGICQSFGPAYAYLCMQLGINAVEVGGSDRNKENSHSWTMLELNGHDYMADPTFEAEMSDIGLLHFGMNLEQRMYTGNYPLEHMTVGFNLTTPDKFDLTDESFFPLWGIQQIYEILRTPEGMVIRGVSDLSELSEEDIIPIENGKTLTLKHMSPWEILMEKLGPEYVALTYSVWSVSGYDIAILDNGEAWIEGENFDGPAQCWVSDRNVLMMDTMKLERGEWELHAERDGTLTIKGKDTAAKAVKNTEADISKFADKYGDFMSQP